MKKTIFFFFASLIVFLVLLSACSHKTIFKNQWQSSTVIVDGNGEDWKFPLRYFDSESKLNYTISNNAENLFICIRTSDKTALTKITQAGMQIWIDTLGKNNKHIGVEFPLSAIERGAEEENTNTLLMSKADITSFQKEVSVKYNEMFLTGFKPPLSARTFKKDTSGLSVTVNYDLVSGLIYEAIIPFKTFLKDKLNASDSTKKLSFCVILNGLPKPKSNDTPSQAPAAMNGRMGAMGGLPGSTSQLTNPLYEKNSFRVKFQVAVNP